MASFHIPGKPGSTTHGSPASSASTPQHTSPKMPSSERAGNGAMMFLGQQCHWHECHREDFLPFKCADCNHPYCAEHFRPQQHACAAAAARDAAEDFRVPLCPICNEPPKDWRRGEDPNIAMERHLGSGQCPALDAGGLLRPGASSSSSSATGASSSTRRVKKANECNFVKCHKVMIVPMHCADCGADFCPSHRAPVQHACTHKASSSDGKGLGPAFKAPTAPSGGQRADGNGIRAARGAFLKKLADAMPSTSASATSSTQPASKERPPSQTSPPKLSTATQSPTSSKSVNTDSQSGPAPSTSSPTSGGGGINLFKTKAERCVATLPHAGERQAGEDASVRGERAMAGEAGGAGGGDEGHRDASLPPSPRHTSSNPEPAPVPSPPPTTRASFASSYAPPALFVARPRA